MRLLHRLDSSRQLRAPLVLEPLVLEPREPQEPQELQAPQAPHRHHRLLHLNNPRHLPHLLRRVRPRPLRLGLQAMER